jgi:hypothetical protein
MARLDCPRLAAAAFQACRHLQDDTPRLLDVLVIVLAQAQDEATLRPEVPERLVAGLAAQVRGEISVGAQEPAAFLADQVLIGFCRTAALELQRLWREDRQDAVRSLGYAMHPVPAMLRDGADLDPDKYELCFAVAAYCWDDYEVSLRAELARQMDMELKEATRLAHEVDFAVDMFGAAQPVDPKVEAKPQGPEGQAFEKQQGKKSWWRFW